MFSELLAFLFFIAVCVLSVLLYLHVGCPSCDASQCPACPVCPNTTGGTTTDTSGGTTTPTTTTTTSSGMPTYYGPSKNNMIWNDGQCKNIGNYPSTPLTDCQAKCNTTTGCTAINVSPNNDCILRQCAQGTLPNNPYPPFNGYAQYNIL